MKLFIVLCALASVALAQEEDRWDMSTCHHIEELEVVQGVDSDCPKEGRDAAVKKALNCRCQTTNADCTDIEAAKKCLCSNRRITAAGVTFTTDEKVRTCPAEPADRVCPEVKECWAADFFTIDTAAQPMTFELSPKFEESLNKLPDALKTRLIEEVMKLEFLKDKVMQMQNEDYVKAMQVIRKLTGYTHRVAQFFKDENGCPPCKIPLCFTKLQVLKPCPAGETPYKDGTIGLISVATSKRPMCPDCRPVAAKAVCDVRPPECKPGQDADIDLASGCPECHPRPPPRCPIATLRALADCAAGVKPVRDPATGCWSCRKSPVCATNRKRPTDADLRVCRFGEQPVADGCTHTCRKPTREEIKEVCTPAAVAKCKANYANLRECAAGEVPEKDYVRCCPSCRRPVTRPAGHVCTAAEVDACKAKTPPCPIHKPDAVCLTTAQKDTVACREHPIGGKYCCKPCYRPETIIKPIDVATCQAALKPCVAGESNRHVDMAKCGSCIEVDPCEAKTECRHGCSVVEQNGKRVARCDEKEVTMGLDIEAGRGLNLDTAKALLTMFIQLPKHQIKTLIQSTLRRFCDTTDVARTERCMGAGLRVIQSIKPLLIKLVIAGVETVLGGANGATLAEAQALLPASMTQEELSKIVCRLTIGFSVPASAGGRRLMADETDEYNIVVDAMKETAAGGGINASPSEPDVVPSGINDEEDGSAGVAVAPSLALVMALLMMFWN